MFQQCVDQLTFDFVPQLPVFVQRHAGQMSSDAGLLPMRQFDERWRYSQRMADCLVDPRRDPEHPFLEMLRQRLYGLFAAYEDCNDHDTLRDDPVFKLVAGRRPDDPPLASQPTLSRFENSIAPVHLQALIDFLIHTGVERLADKHGRQLPPQVTLDLDPTDDPTHGHQQLSLFHGYYEQYQYYPLIISEPTTKHIFLAWLRPGTVHAALGADDDLMRVVDALRTRRADIAIHARGDCGFGVPWMYSRCEEQGLSYTFGLSSNARLKRLMQPLLDRAVRQYACTGQKQRLFTVFSYKADTWDRYRTVIAKAECHRRGTNLRFIVTNLPITSPGDAQRLYDQYVQRGESEHRMDELKNGLSADRLSCHRFMANFWRLLLHTAAFNLINAVRDHQPMPKVLRTGQPCTWRTRLIKVAATVIQSTRRILVQLPAQWPWWSYYQMVSQRSLAAMPAGP